jgi:hypothetical protein
VNLAALRLPPGVAVAIYAGSIPADAAFDSNAGGAIDDPVVVRITYRGQVIVHMESRREDWGRHDLDTEYIQGEIDSAVARGEQPPGPKLVK